MEHPDRGFAPFDAQAPRNPGRPHGANYQIRGAMGFAALNPSYGLASVALRAKFCRADSTENCYVPASSSARRVALYLCLL
jgi:hypothetical protein